VPVSGGSGARGGALEGHRHAFRVLVGAALAAALFAGCKTRSAVGMQMVLPPMAEVMDIPKDKAFLMASPVSQPLPEYPSGVERDASARVCIEFVVAETGAVSSATPIYGLPECPAWRAQLDPGFVDAALQAARRWQFLAAAICTFPPGSEVTDDCSGDGVEVRPVAIRIAYAFAFQRGGRVTAEARGR